MADINRDKIKANGWALGKVFSSKSAPSICDQIIDVHKDDDQIFIAVTHDCSVISPSLKDEPHLEYLSAKQIDKENGQFTNARNIRRLHLGIKQNGENAWYEVSMGMRGFVSRNTIEECSTDDRFSLPTESINTLKRWLANRYISQTFPDKFNQLTTHLVRGSKAPLIKAFDSEVGKACNSIFISLTPDDRDIDGDETYAVVVALLFRDELANGIGRDALDSFGEEVQIILDSVQGLDPVDVHSLAESDATYSQIIKMSRWQLDYVSIQDGTEILAVEHS